MLNQLCTCPLHKWLYDVGVHIYNANEPEPLEYTWIGLAGPFIYLTVPPLLNANVTYIQ